MPVDPVEALADAIMTFEGWRPASRSYRNRNPGNMRATRPEQPQDLDGYRIFPSLRDGYVALLLDLDAKCEGRTRTGLRPASTLLEFFRVWAPEEDSNRPERYVAFAVRFMSRALGREITPQTTLGELVQLPGGG